MTTTTAKITDIAALAAEVDRLEKLASPTTADDRQMAALLDQLREAGVNVTAWQDEAADAIAQECRPVTMARFVRRGA